MLLNSQNEKIFKLEKKEFLSDIKSEVYLLRHIKTNALVIFFANEDNNKAFTLSLQTPPYSSNGITHILEHSVLNGSKKYPCKEPFVELLKSSCANFINAMTFSDKTIYPFASLHEKDFLNLMSVYLDAVYFPNLLHDERILQQEGWHYHLEDENDDLQYKGIVFNEMKGALSQPERDLYHHISKHLLKNTIYQHLSGGHPSEIINLTQTEFINYHQKYYHPSNSVCYLYGNLDINQCLHELDKTWREFTARTDLTIDFGNFQEEHQKIIDFYPINEAENPNEKTFFSLSFAHKKPFTREEEIGLKFLINLLFGNTTSPLKQKILDAKICQDAYAELETASYFPYISIVASGCEPANFDRFKEIVFTELTRLSKDGFAEDYLASQLNSYSFDLREFTLLEGSTPKGILLAINSLEGLMYNDNPFKSLRLNDDLAKLKENIKNNFLSYLIDKYLLNNLSLLEHIFQPKQGLSKEKEEAFSKRLKDYKNSLTALDLHKLKENTHLLLKRQTETDDPANLATIPLLKLSDFSLNLPHYDLKITNNSTLNYYWANLDTANISYIKYIFDLQHLPTEDIFYISLLKILLGELSTKKYNFTDLQTKLQFYTGGFSSSTTIFSKKNNPFAEFMPSFLLFAKTLSNYQKETLELLMEIAINTSFEDKKRIKSILTMYKSQYEMGLLQNSHVVANERLKSYSLPIYKYKQYLDGIDFYDQLTLLLENFSTSFDELKNNLYRIQKLIFKQANCSVLFVGQEDEFLAFRNYSEKIVAKNLCPAEIKQVPLNLPLENLNEGFFTAQDVFYVAKGFLVKISSDENKKKEQLASLKYLQSLLSLDFYWNKIRVEGGAYGAFATLDTFSFFSGLTYRDPQFLQTLAVFDQSSDYLSAKEFTEDEFAKLIIRNLADYFRPLSPLEKANQALNLYLSGKTYSDLEAELASLIKLTPADIYELSPLINDVFSDAHYVVVGNEQKIKEEKNLFKNIRPLIK